MIVVNLYYTGKNGAAREFANEMESSGIADKVRNEKGNLGYEYFFSQKDEETVLLVDKWADEQAIDDHHKSEMIKEIAKLRDKYKLRLKVEKFIKE